ncbi:MULTISPECIES: MlaD family protein [unclassified Mycolicibacterium]|uniref:MlaD family protein n=1 Tax=unclassified Mycolicibacterium TaxID=2636767 RepID=UPI0012DC3CDF|nr:MULTISPECIES: MlaD family protein [unclassified Mycolicibacterium]MUL82307.1 MCE family protein [Mycolicibacterium sp. CBMA 329]MUL88073.1 MCE family protein [Mycolicibacterium sp. CBMA 331]MUM02403.1 MCE family protein [Mycolicibacterium sp. CBMA 334]MUM24806.1 MCE family protein [Mycolicibacterium sp. CBMA 295]MUM38370.1 MCE family protein [Mycolicibacterium sp. CBMA 247]
MRAAKNIASFVAFAVIIAIASVYVGSFGLRMGPPERRINLSMAVPDVKGLVVGSSVLLRGVPIGEITGISSSVDDATIHFYINGGQRIPVDSDVRLDNLSALGEAYVGFLPRTDEGPVLTDGQRIATESVTVPPSISQLATSVVRVLNQMDPEQLKRIVNEADAGLPDPGQVLPNLSRASLLTRNMVVGMNGKGQEVLDNFQTLLRDAGWVGPKLAAVDEPLRAAGRGVAESLTAMMNAIAWNNPTNMQKFGDFIVRIQKFLDASASDLKVVGNALLPQFQGIGGALMNFDTAQILSNALSGIPEEGAITLHVTVPDN